VNKKTTYWIIGIAITGLAFYYLFRNKMSKTQRQVVFQANAEADKWRGYDENDDAVGNIINQYWCDGVGICGYTNNQVVSDGFNEDYPWSAAFVSWVMKASGADSFPADASHSNYIIETTINREVNPKDDFTAWALGEQKPEPSDIVCANRAGSNASYGNVVSGMPLHCDIVTKVNSDTIEVVGGNINNRVQRKTLNLNNEGYLSHQDYFTIIKNNA